MRPDQQARFDALVGEEIDALPDRLLDLLQRVAVIVLDEPTAQMLEDLGETDPAEAALICGLHSGTGMTERSIEDTESLPSTVHLFRRGIVGAACGWEQGEYERKIREQIRITLLHELGHEFGLEEDDLADLGFE